MQRHPRFQRVGEAVTERVAHDNRPIKAVQDGGLRILLHWNKFKQRVNVDPEGHIDPRAALDTFLMAFLGLVERDRNDLNRFWVFLVPFFVEPRKVFFGWGCSSIPARKIQKHNQFEPTYCFDLFVAYTLVEVVTQDV